MAVRVTIRKKDPDVPDDFILGILSGILRMDEEEFKRIKAEDGSVSLYVKDSEAVLKLRQIAERHSSLVEIVFSESPSEGGLFSITNTAVRSNWGLALSWCAFVLVVFLLSFIPLIGFFFNIVFGAFYCAFTLFVSYNLMGGEIDSDSVSRVMKSLRFGEVFSKYIGAGFGFWLGLLLIYVVGTVFFLGSAVALLNSIQYGRTGGDNSAAIFIAIFIIALLVFFFWLWAIYSLPLMFSRVLRRGESLSFKSSLRAVISLFTPSFLKESFSNTYFSVGGMWSLVFTVGLFGTLLLFALIVTVPIALLTLYWMQIFLSLSVVSYIRKL
jgi:hypothetical protein